MTGRHPERGVTLTEVTVVFILAAIVMTGLLVFYLNSQSVWMDGSTQVITQREATLVLNAITARARRSNGSHVTFTPDVQHVQIDLDMPGAPQESTYSYWWGADSLIHEGYLNTVPPVDRGPMLMSNVDCFAATGSDTLLTIDSLRVRSGNGVYVTMSTTVAMQNRGAP